MKNITPLTVMFALGLLAWIIFYVSVWLTARKAGVPMNPAKPEQVRYFTMYGAPYRPGKDEFKKVKTDDGFEIRLPFNIFQIQPGDETSLNARLVKEYGLLKADIEALRPHISVKVFRDYLKNAEYAFHQAFTLREVEPLERYREVVQGQTKLLSCGGAVFVHACTEVSPALRVTRPADTAPEPVPARPRRAQPSAPSAPAFVADQEPVRDEAPISDGGYVDSEPVWDEAPISDDGHLDSEPVWDEVPVEVPVAAPAFVPDDLTREAMEAEIEERRPFPNAPAFVSRN